MVDRMNDEIKNLHDKILNYKGALYGSGKCVIFRSKDGDINPPVELLVIGEAPGYYESISGVPFVGKAGKELDKILDFLGFNYVITNVVKYRPTDENGQDRKPTQEEVESWLPLLEEQISLYKPKVILLLGDTALKAVLKLNMSITQVSKSFKTFYHQKIPTFVYFHPSYLVRNNYDWKSDIEKLKDLMKKYI